MYNRSHQLHQAPIETNGAVLLNLARLKSTNQHFKFLTDETLVGSQLNFLMQASENVVCIHCIDNDMSMDLVLYFVFVLYVYIVQITI